MTPRTRTSSSPDDSIGQTFPDIDKRCSDGIDWLYSEWRDDETGIGWPHSQLYDHVTAWGGTMEAVRSLVEVGESEFNPKIKRSIDWLESRQTGDGGWELWETTRSTVESTAWGIITLRRANKTLDNRHLSEASQYLSDTAQEQATGYAWGAAKNHDCRIYSTLVATLALDGLKQELSEGGAEWLKTVSNRDGGWGFRPNDDSSNVAMTAMVLYALRRVRAIQVDDKITQDAKEFLLKEQDEEGYWENKSESWSVEGDGQITMEHGTQPWAILALLETNIDVSHPQMITGVSCIAEQQISNGAFLYDFEDSEERVWYTANCIVALNEFAERLASPEGINAVVNAAVTNEFGPLSRDIEEIEESISNLEDDINQLADEVATYSIVSHYLVPILYILVIFIALIASDLHQTIIGFFLSNANALIVTVVGAILSVVLTVAIQRSRVGPY